MKRKKSHQNIEIICILGGRMQSSRIHCMEFDGQLRMEGWFYVSETLPKIQIKIDSFTKFTIKTSFSNVSLTVSNSDCTTLISRVKKKLELQKRRQRSMQTLLRLVPSIGNFSRNQLWLHHAIWTMHRQVSHTIHLLSCVSHSCNMHSIYCLEAEKPHKFMNYWKNTPLKDQIPFRTHYYFQIISLIY